MKLGTVLKGSRTKSQELLVLRLLGGLTTRVAAEDASAAGAGRALNFPPGGGGRTFHCLSRDHCLGILCSPGGRSCNCTSPRVWGLWYVARQGLLEVPKNSV